MNTFEELTKDWATDEQLKQWMADIADELPKRYVEGIFCVTSPKSEGSFTGAYCDFMTAQFLIKSIIENIAKASNTSPTLMSALLTYYFAQIEEGVIDEKKKKITEKLLPQAKKRVKETLRFVMKKTQGVNPFSNKLRH